MSFIILALARCYFLHLSYLLTAKVTTTQDPYSLIVLTGVGFTCMETFRLYKITNTWLDSTLESLNLQVHWRIQKYFPRGGCLDFSFAQICQYKGFFLIFGVNFSLVSRGLTATNQLLMIISSRGFGDYSASLKTYCRTYKVALLDIVVGFFFY